MRIIELGVSSRLDPYEISPCLSEISEGNKVSGTSLVGKTAILLPLQAGQ